MPTAAAYSCQFQRQNLLQLPVVLVMPLQWGDETCLPPAAARSNPHQWECQTLICLSLQLYAPYFCNDTVYDQANGGRWPFLASDTCKLAQKPEQQAAAASSPTFQEHESVFATAACLHGQSSENGVVLVVVPPASIVSQRGVVPIAALPGCHGYSFKNVAPEASRDFYDYFLAEGRKAGMV